MLVIRAVAELLSRVLSSGSCPQFRFPQLLALHERIHRLLLRNAASALHFLTAVSEPALEMTSPPNSCNTTDIPLKSLRANWQI
jgi:hypothetical protein